MTLACFDKGYQCRWWCIHTLEGVDEDGRCGLVGRLPVDEQWF